MYGEYKMIELTLPYPPSNNTYYRHVGNRVLLSEAGRNYRREALRTMLTNRSGGLSGRVAVTVRVYPPDRRKRDLDNVLKGLLDSLTHSGAIEDDGMIDYLTVSRHEVMPGGQVIVTISRLHEQRASHSNANAGSEVAVA